MKACPLCHRQGTLLLVATSGFWERFVLSPLGWHPYRCRACGNRIVRRQSPSSYTPAQPSNHAPAADALPEAGFLPPRDAQPFDSLIRKLEQSEEEQGLRPSPEGRPSRHSGQGPPTH